MSNPPSSPALRLLQVSSDGKSIAGRSPCTGKRSPSSNKRKELKAKGGEASRKISSFFPKETETIDKVEGEVATAVEIRCAQSNVVDVGVNTELQLKDFDNEKSDLELLFRAGSSAAYWKDCADVLSEKLRQAILEKVACDDELEELEKEMVDLQNELNEYKEYFALRETMENNSDGEQE